MSDPYRTTNGKEWKEILLALIIIFGAVVFLVGWLIALAEGDGMLMFMLIVTILTIILVNIAIVNKPTNLRLTQTTAPKDPIANAVKTAERERVKKVKACADVMGVPSKRVEKVFYEAKHIGVKEAFEDVKVNMTHDSYLTTMASLVNAGVVSKEIADKAIETRDETTTLDLKAKADRINEIFQEWEVLY
jgi:uncharacterized membrane protein